MRLYSLLVLLGWIGLGEAMKCALISMQGQHYTQPQHVAMGQYAVMKKKSGGHAVYELASMQQSKHPLYLYFRKSEGFWCIGPTIGSKKYQLYMRSQEETPLSTRLSGSWHVQINPKSFKSGAFVRALNVKADCVSAPMAAGELTTPVVGSSAGAVFGDEEPYSGGDQSGEFHGVSTQTLVFASCAAAVVVMISWTALGKQLAKAAAAREAEALEAGVVPSVGNAYQESSGLIN
jgi:hypothetical protein